MESYGELNMEISPFLGAELQGLWLSYWGAGIPNITLGA